MGPGAGVVATRYLGIVPTMRGFEKNLGKQLTSGPVMSQANTAGRSIGSRMSEGLKSSLKTGVKLTVGGILGLTGAAVGGGISRQLNIEDAKKKMESLGHTSKDVAQIMGSNGPVLKSVKGTAFAMDDAATVASGAMAAGVDPAKDLEGYLKMTADAATIAGVSMGEMGFVMNKVQTSQTAYTEDLNMLADRGIPIFQWLQEEYNVSAQELKKMVADGKVDAKTYFKVINENIGGAALKSGETTRGAFKNMLSALSRVGVALTSGIFPLFRTAFNGIGKIFDALEPKVTEIMGPLFERFGGEANAGLEKALSGIATWISKLNVTGASKALAGVATAVRGFFMAFKNNKASATSSGLPAFMEQLGVTARQLFEVFRNADYSSFGAFFDSLGSINFSALASNAKPALEGIGGGLGKILSAAPTLLAAGLNLLGDALQFLATHMGTIAPLLPVIIAGWAAWKAATQVTAAAQARANLLQAQMIPLVTVNNGLMLANTILERQNAGATNATSLATTRATIAEKGRALATKAGALVTKLAAGAMRLFGAALRFATGPIGWIITGVALLGTALYLFFTKTDVGRALWAKIWTAIKGAVAAVMNWLQTVALPAILAVWDRIVAGAMWLWKNGILPAWNGIKTAIHAVSTWIMGTLVPWLKGAWTAIASSAQWLYRSVIIPVWNGIKVAIVLVAAVVMTYIQLWVGFFRKVVAPVFMWLWKTIIVPVWNGIKSAIGAVVSWFSNTAWPWISRTIESVKAAFVRMKVLLTAVWLTVRARVIQPVISWFANTAWPFIQRTINAIKTAFTVMRNTLATVWRFIRNNVIQPVISWFGNTAWPLIQSVINRIKTAFGIMRNVLASIWRFVRNNVIQPVVSWFSNTVWPIINSVIGRIKTAFGVMRDVLKRVWGAIRNTVIQPVVSWFSNTVWPALNRVIGRIKTGFSQMKDAVGKAWNGIKEAAAKPVRFVVDTVINNGIVKNFNAIAGKVGVSTRLPNVKFATGGVMPGYTPGRDVHKFYSPTGGLLELSGGEPILRPEVGRVLGHDWVNNVNAAARTGGISGVKRSLGFATGGIFPGMPHQAFGVGGWFKDLYEDGKKQAKKVWKGTKKKAGEVWEGTKSLAGDAWDGAKFLGKAVLDPVGSLKKLGEALISKIPGAGGALDLAKGMGSKIVGMASQAFQGAMSAILPGGSAGPPVKVPAGASRSLGYARKVASAHGLAMTSWKRPGARTSSGSPSMHGLGRAMDFSNSSGPTPQMMAFFNAMHPLKPTELLYSPAGGRQWRRGGRMANTSGTVRRIHFNHVHVAFNRGGIMPELGSGFAPSVVPTLYDQGGTIPPGVSVIANKTNRPEKVLPPNESAALTRLANRGETVEKHFHYSPNQVDMDEQVERRTRREFETMVHAASQAVVV